MAAQLSPYASLIAKADWKRDTAAMTKAVARTKTRLKKRRQGRPAAGENNVGRELLLAAAEKLLRTMPPARVTIARVAQEANADPSLVRYYFGSRTALLVAVVDRVTAHGMHGVRRKDEPTVALADHIGKTVQFIGSAPFMHRLMIDELAQAGTKESRARVKAMNLDLVEFYRELLSADGGRELVDTDPLFLHLAVLGASDFFSAGEPLIRELLPPGTDMKKLTAGFQKFLVKLVLDGLRTR
jgi:AcrR family transcriptional regulator